MMNDDHLLHGSVISDTVTNTNFDSFRLVKELEVHRIIKNV